MSSGMDDSLHQQCDASLLLFAGRMEHIVVPANDQNLKLFLTNR